MGNQITKIKNDTVETVENISKTRCNCKCNCFVSNSEDDEQPKNIPINLNLDNIGDNKKNLFCNNAIKEYNELLEIKCTHYLETKINCCQNGRIFTKEYNGYRNKFSDSSNDNRWVVLLYSSIESINTDSKKYYNEFNKKTILEIEFLFKKGCCFLKDITTKKKYELDSDGVKSFF